MICNKLLEYSMAGSARTIAYNAAISTSDLTSRFLNAFT